MTNAARFRRHAAAWCVGALALELWALAWLPIGRVSASGRRPMVLTEFGTGQTITQGFTAQANGLQAIRVEVAATPAGDVTIDWRFFPARAPNDAASRPPWSTVNVPNVSGSRWVTFDMPFVAQSSGKMYALELKLTGARPLTSGARPEVALLASRDRSLSESYLFVGAEERWGSLNFDTVSRGDRFLGRFMLNGLTALPAALQHRSLAIVALIMFNALMAGVIIGLCGTSVGGSTGPRASRGRMVLGALLGALLVAALGAVAVVARAERGRINLIDELDGADLRSTIALHEAFKVMNVEIGVQSKRVLFEHSTSRVSWHVTIPAHAVLLTDIAIHPNAWRREGGDGVQFRILAVRGSQTAELYGKFVNPRIASDQRWRPVEVDLSAYAGQTIELIFATEPSLPGHPPDSGNDWAIWAEPRIK